MAEPTGRERFLAANLDRAIVMMSKPGISNELHEQLTRDLLANALAAYRVELLGEKQPSVEVRNDCDGALDEVVARNVQMFHLEYMDHDRVWMALYWGDQQITINLIAEGSIRGTVESDGDPPIAIEVTNA